MNNLRANIVASLLFLFSVPSFAGPVVIGGDDLNDHGSWDGSANLLGWLYIQNALASLVSQVTLPGNDGAIVVLGSDPSDIPTATSSDGCTAAEPTAAVVPTLSPWALLLLVAGLAGLALARVERRRS